MKHSIIPLFLLQTGDFESHIRYIYDTFSGSPVPFNQLKRGADIASTPGVRYSQSDPKKTQVYLAGARPLRHIFWEIIPIQDNANKKVISPKRTTADQCFKMLISRGLMDSKFPTELKTWSSGFSIQQNPFGFPAYLPPTVQITYGLKGMVQLGGSFTPPPAGLVSKNVLHQTASKLGHNADRSRSRLIYVSRGLFTGKKSDNAIFDLVYEVHAHRKGIGLSKAFYLDPRSRKPLPEFREVPGKANWSMVNGNPTRTSKTQKVWPHKLK